MTDILKGYNLGELGVNVAKSPIHLTDGELVSAQNAEFYTDSGRGAIRKRPGLQRFNGSSLAGAIYGVIGVPLPSPNERLVLVSVQDSAQTAPEFAGSTDGTTFATVAGMPSTGNSLQDSHADQSGTVLNYMNPVAVYNGFAFVPADPNAVNLTAGRLLALERLDTPSGSIQARIVEVVVFPSAAVIEAIFRYKQLIYVAVRGNGISNFVYELNPETGAITRLGPSSAFAAGTENIFSGAGFLGRIFIGTSRASQGRIHSLRVGDASWTLDETAAAGLHTITSMAVYKGNLYAGTSAAAGTAALIRQRTPGGTWSTVRTGSHSVQANYWDCLFVHEDELYAVYMTRGATDICEIHKYDGSSWSTDEDLAALTSTPSYILGRDSYAGQLLLTSLDEAAGTQRVLVRSTAGAWSVVNPGASGSSAYLAVL